MGEARRFGIVIGLRDECVAAYRALHDGPGVRDLLHAANIRDFSIFLARMPDGKLYEFGRYDYVGDDYATDMANLAAHPRNIVWLQHCDPMQRPLPGAAGWMEIQEIFHNP